MSYRASHPGNAPDLRHDAGWRAPEGEILRQDGHLPNHAEGRLHIERAGEPGTMSQQNFLDEAAVDGDRGAWYDPRS